VEEVDMAEVQLTVMETSDSQEHYVAEWRSCATEHWTDMLMQHLYNSDEVVMCVMYVQIVWTYIIQYFEPGFISCIYYCVLNIYNNVKIALAWRNKCDI
jgi:hypothetical protein